MERPDISTYRARLAEECLRRSDRLADVNGNPIYDLELHQSEAMVGIADALNEGENSALVVQSGGTGKTLLISGLVQASRAADRDEVYQDIVLAPERAIITNIRSHFDALGIDYSLYAKGERPLDRQVVLSTIQACVLGQKNKTLPFNPSKVGLIIGDEADLHITDKRRKTINDIGPNAFRLGLTATPNRLDNRDITEVWGKIIHKLSINQAITLGLVVSPVYYLLEASIDGDKIPINRGDYERRALSLAMKHIEIEKAIPDVLKKFVPESFRKDFATLVYVPSVKLAKIVAKNLQASFGEEGLRVSQWDSQMSNDRLNLEIEALQNGSLDIVVLCEMGGRGLNVPRVGTIIDADPTTSFARVEQRDARCMRKSHIGFEKSAALIIQIIPQSNHFRPVTMMDVLSGQKEYEPGILLSGDRVPDDTLPLQLLQRQKIELRKLLLNGRLSPALKIIEKFEMANRTKLLSELPIADENGFFFVDGEEYAHLNGWGKLLAISPDTIAKRLGSHRGIDGVTSRGRFLRNSFFSRTIVEDACEDLLSANRANEDGFFMLNGETYGNMGAWVRKHRGDGLSDGIFLGFIKIHKPRFVVGLGSKGGLAKFFAESDISRVLEKLRLKPTLADGETFWNIDGRKYATAKTWAHYFGISYEKILSHLHNKKIISSSVLVGDPPKHRKVYPEYQIIESCSSLIFMRGKDKEGLYLDRNGVRWGTPSLWARVLSHEASGKLQISGWRIKNRIRTLGFDDNSRRNPEDSLAPLPENFCSENSVRTACADLLGKEIPKVDADGVIRQAGHEYMTVDGWSKRFGIGKNRLRKTIETSKMHHRIIGRCANEQLRVFYPFTAVESILLENSQRDSTPLSPDKNGFAFFKGVRYALTATWGKKLFFASTGLIQKRILTNGVVGINAFGKNGCPCTFYSEDDVCNLCRDLLPTLSERGHCVVRLKSEQATGVFVYNEEVFCTLDYYLDVKLGRFDFPKSLIFALRECLTKNLIAKDAFAAPSLSHNGKILKDSIFRERDIDSVFQLSMDSAKKIIWNNKEGNTMVLQNPRHPHNRELEDPNEQAINLLMHGHKFIVSGGKENYGGLQGEVVVKVPENSPLDRVYRRLICPNEHEILVVVIRGGSRFFVAKVNPKFLKKQS